MAVSDDLYASALSLLTDFGEPMTISRVTPGAYNPATGLTGTPTTVNYPGQGRLGNYADVAVDGTIIQQFDRRVTFVAVPQDFVPQIGDRLIVGATTYAIINLKPREIGGNWVCFTMQARR